ncbi:CLUMA_CG006440, isoform A [Clunio marinus]|uniref:CLUMA_CG006440, isoform A n=1 Tax=Clunio marinus TaxID=568069 RepID=A0A1J1HXM8_9DIPT|nr:CLUMA_CG006440, isoform A [Clunio marinus]
MKFSKKKFRQVWIDNMGKTSEPEIEIQDLSISEVESVHEMEIESYEPEGDSILEISEIDFDSYNDDNSIISQW